MAENVFLIRSVSPDFEETVETPVDLSGEEADHVPDELVGREAVRLWGVPAPDNGNNYFDAMGDGGLALFHQEDRFIGVGEIGTTVMDTEEVVSEMFWEELETPAILTVEDYVSVDVPRAAVHRIFDYSESYSPGDVMRVADDRVDRSLPVIRRAIEKYSEKHSE